MGQKKTIENPSTDALDNVVDVLALARPSETRHMRARLRAGKIDGAKFGLRSECGCLLGTIAKQRGIPIPDEEEASVFATRASVYEFLGLTNEDYRDFVTIGAERVFAYIRPGDTPGNSPSAKRVDDRITELTFSNPRVFRRASR